MIATEGGGIMATESGGVMATMGGGIMATEGGGMMATEGGGWSRRGQREMPSLSRVWRYFRALRVCSSNVLAKLWVPSSVSRAHIYR